jgi:TRAP-type uncharacterized transport system substrate-binding protein
VRQVAGSRELARFSRPPGVPVTRQVRFAASGVGSFWYEIGTLVERALAGSGFELVLETSTSDHRNVRAVGGGDCEIGVTMPPFVDWANRRFGVLEDADLAELVVIAAINQPVWLAAAIERAAGIGELREVARRKYPWRPVMLPADQVLGVYVDRLLELHGLSRESLRQWGGGDLGPNLRSVASENPPIPRVMKPVTREHALHGRTDGFFLYTSWTVQWVRDLTSILDLRFLTFEESALDVTIREFGGEKLTLPARLFPGADDDQLVIGWRHQYVYGTLDTEPDLVTAVLRGLEGAGDRVLLNAQGHSYSPGAPALLPGVRLHPAAAAYYVSHGSGEPV